ncbi:phosphotransferase family protein [Asanoa siamensis]|uniref:Spectinomycin phosphotransferase n=1 Tax=Asanoa siamensis TaxID=926357 RepID=A0ABQ4CN57_9ACTN|nr:phosphotransferase [Asanoa siamensis]GIF72724.1 hypothetical protein Asi02nite_22420 [Asanoa siamensis]
MRDRPAGVTDTDLVSGLAAGWGLAVRTVDYLPVGAGSYHWSAVTTDDRRWFVTVDDVAGGAALDAALATALRLRAEAGLDFVVAPVATVTGGPTWRLTPRHALSVYPHVDGTTGDFGPHPPADRARVVDLLAALHLATPVVAATAPRADPRLAGRDGLDRALADLDRRWPGGPYAEPARDLLARHADRVAGWLADFDGLVAEIQATSASWVVTHGEPHPGNVLQSAEGPRLLDWETVRLAPSERDLWLLDPDPALLTRYTEATGIAVSPAVMAFYRLRWRLDDIAIFVDDLRRPHGATDDPAAALRYLTGYLTWQGD